LSKSKGFDVYATTLEPEIPPEIPPSPTPIEGWSVSTVVLDTPAESESAQ
jgi:hypothetical protein